VLAQKEPYFQPVELPNGATRYEFDLLRTETWENLPPAESLSSVIVTFPLQLGPSRQFWEHYLKQVPRVICYSSTSVYRVDTPGQLVDEGTPLRETPRSTAEQFMQQQGAIILTISGIFGEPRGPRGVCTCLSTYSSAGGQLNGMKSINMVHVRDIVHATERCLALARTGVRLNVAGVHFLLRDLINHCKHPRVPDSTNIDLTSKRVSSKAITECVMPDDFSFTPPYELEPDSVLTCTCKQVNGEATHDA